MSDTIRFAGGDELVVPFVILAGEDIVDLGGGALAAEIWWRGAAQVSIGLGTGLEILDENPAPAAGDDEQEAHGNIRIDEARSATLPLGRTAFLRVVFVSAAGVTVSSEPIWLERLL